MPVERRAEEVKNGAREGTEMAKRDQTSQEPQSTAATATSAQGQSGAAARPDGDGPEDTVSRTLRQKATYENLMEEAVSPENFCKALKAVVTNDGAPGIDGMKAADLEKHLEAHWEKIRAKLLAGAYVPTPVKRVEIPKPSGGVRMLGIPTVSANCTRAQFAFGMGGDPPSVPSASRPALRSFEGAANSRY